MKNTEAHGEIFANVRELVTFLNDRNIQKSDVLKILTVNGQLFLIYYA